MKRVILTGGNSGIGKELLKKYLLNNYKITLGVLNINETNSIINNIISSISTSNTSNTSTTSTSNNLTPSLNYKENIEIKYLNLNDFQSIKDFSLNINECHLLINCAGIINYKYEKINEIEKTMSTNYLGHFLLTNLLLPTIKKTSEIENIECRIINVTSSTEKEAKAFPGTDGDFGKSALRGELPDSIKFQDKVSSSETYYGLLSGTKWITEGPQPYFMQTAYSNSSLCIILSTIELSRRLNPHLHTIIEDQEPPSAPTPTSIKYNPQTRLKNRKKKFPLKNNSTEEIEETIEIENEEEEESTTNSQTKARVTINAVCPGYVNTPFWSNISFVNYFGRYFFKSAGKGSELIYQVSTSSEYDGVSGKFFTSIPNIQPSKMIQSKELAEHVWNHSCEVVGI